MNVAVYSPRHQGHSFSHGQRPNQLFRREKTSLTKGEQDIICGIFKNRGLKSNAVSPVFYNLCSHKQAWYVDLETLSGGWKYSNKFSEDRQLQERFREKAHIKEVNRRHYHGLKKGRIVQHHDSKSDKYTGTSIMPSAGPATNLKLGPIKSGRNGLNQNLYSITQSEKFRNSKTRSKTLTYMKDFGHEHDGGEIQTPPPSLCASSQSIGLYK